MHRRSPDEVMRPWPSTTAPSAKAAASRGSSKIPLPRSRIFAAPSRPWRSAAAGLPMIGVGICVGAGYMARAVAEDDRFDAFAGIAGVYGAAAPDAEYSPSVIRGTAAEQEWKETGQAEMIPAVGPDGGDIAMPLREAYEYYGTSRGAVPNYTNGYAVQSFAYTGIFDSQGAAPLIKVPAIVIHSENAMIPKLAHSFIEGLTSPHEQLWLQSQGQIDFYDDPRLINAAADAIVSFVSTSNASQGEARWHE